MEKLAYLWIKLPILQDYPGVSKNWRLNRWTLPEAKNGQKKKNRIIEQKLCCFRFLWKLLFGSKVAGDGQLINNQGESNWLIKSACIPIGFEKMIKPIALRAGWFKMGGHVMDVPGKWPANTGNPPWNNGMRFDLGSITKQVKSGLLLNRHCFDIQHHWFQGTAWLESPILLQKKHLKERTCNQYRPQK